MANNNKNTSGNGGNQKRCNFCGRSDSEVGLLIGGDADTFICDDCVAQINSLLNEPANAFSPYGAKKTEVGR